MPVTQKDLSIDAGLYMRLSVIAEQQGISAEELASVILEDHAHSEEQDRITRSHLEYRWQTYLETGETVSSDDIQSKLRRYAAEAARRVEV